MWTYTSPMEHGDIFKKLVECLVLLVVLEKANDSKWRAPYFTNTERKINWVRFLGKFRDFNKQLKLKPYLMPKVNKMFLEL